MNKTILFFCVFSITVITFYYSTSGRSLSASALREGSGESIQGNEDSARYFPLKIGNKYYYRHVRTGTCANDSGDYVSRIQDTVRINGRLYFRMNTVFDWGSASSERYFRYNADSGRLVGYDQYVNYCDYEKVQYKLTMVPNENLILMCLYLNPQTCQGIRDSMVFGAQRKVKVFYHSSGSQTFSISSRSILAKDIGLTRYTYTYTNPMSGYTCTDVFDLKGAYVNGVVYGDTLTGVEQTGSEIPVRFELRQNYPNPFNASTVVRFSLSVVSDVAIRVYDVIGREVAVLVNERMEAGDYERVFDGSGLGSGVYYCGMESGGEKEVRRMVLLK